MYVCITVTVTVTDNLLQHELQKSLHPFPVVSRQLRRPVYLYVCMYAIGMYAMISLRALEASIFIL